MGKTEDDLNRLHLNWLCKTVPVHGPFFKGLSLLLVTVQ